MGNQFQEKVQEMEKHLEERNSELEKCRQWKIKFVKLKKEMRSKNVELEECKTLLAKREEFIDLKLKSYQEKSDQIVISVSNDFEKNMETNIKYFQDLVKKCN